MKTMVKIMVLFFLAGILFSCEKKVGTSDPPSTVTPGDSGKMRELEKKANQEEEQRKANEARLAEEQRKAEAARIAEDKRKADEARLAEEQRKAETARIAEEQRKAEAARIAEEQRKAETARLAEEQRKVETARIAEEQRKAEAARLAEEQRKAEAARLAEEQRKAETARIAEERRKAETARLAEEQRKAEAARLAEEQRKAEAARLAEEQRKAEAARLAEERRRAEEARIAEERRKAEVARIAEEQRRRAETAISNADKKISEIDFERQNRFRVDYNEAKGFLTNARDFFNAGNWNMVTQNTDRAINKVVWIMEQPLIKDAPYVHFLIKDTVSGVPIKYGEIRTGIAKNAGRSGRITEREKNQLLKEATKVDSNQDFGNGMLNKRIEEIKQNNTMFFIISRRGNGGYASYVPIKDIFNGYSIDVPFSIENEVYKIPFSIKYPFQKYTFSEGDTVAVIFYYRERNDEINDELDNAELQSPVIQVKLEENSGGIIELNTKDLNVSPSAQIDYRFELKGKLRSGGDTIFKYKGRLIQLWDIEKDAPLTFE
jgi:hypothetical protein